jgi:hypothetical protein
MSGLIIKIGSQLKAGNYAICLISCPAHALFLIKNRSEGLFVMPFFLPDTCFPFGLSLQGENLDCAALHQGYAIVVFFFGSLDAAQRNQGYRSNGLV